MHVTKVIIYTCTCLIHVVYSNYYFLIDNDESSK